MARQLQQTPASITWFILIVCVQLVAAAFRPTSFVDPRTNKLHSENVWSPTGNGGRFPLDVKAQADGDYSTVVGVGTKFSADHMDLSGGSLLVEGELTLKQGISGNCREVAVDGRLQADLSGIDTVRVGGQHIGNVKCAQLIVESKGEVRGDVDTNLLILKPGGRVEGVVKCDRISSEVPSQSKGQTQSIDQTLAHSKQAAPLNLIRGASSTSPTPLDDVEDSVNPYLKSLQEQIGYDQSKANGQRQPLTKPDEVLVTNVGGTGLKLKSVEQANGSNGALQPSCSVLSGPQTDQLGNPTDSFGDRLRVMTPPEVCWNGANRSRQQVGSATTGQPPDQSSIPADSFGNLLTVAHPDVDRNGANGSRFPNRKTPANLAQNLGTPTDSFGNPLTVTPPDVNGKGPNTAHRSTHKKSESSVDENGNSLPTDSFGNSLVPGRLSRDENGVNGAYKPNMPKDDLIDPVSSKRKIQTHSPTSGTEGIQTDSFGNPLYRSNLEANADAFRRSQEALAQTRQLTDAYLAKQQKNARPAGQQHLRRDDDVPGFLRKGRGGTK